MWGFEILRSRASGTAVAEANRHFAAALESRRELGYLRLLQISPLLQTYTNVWIGDPEREAEAIKVANDMRLRGKPRPEGWTAVNAVKGAIWSIYHFDVVNTDTLPMRVLAALPPDQHLPTFLWLFPEDDLPEGVGAPSLFSYYFALAQLQEQARKRDGALASYDRVLREFASKGYNSSQSVRIAEIARAAVEGLSS